MIVLELGSTGAEEMSVFQRLLPAKGTKPPRLAPCPVDITLQARLPLPVPPPPLPPEPPPLLPPPILEAPEHAVKDAPASNEATKRMNVQAEWNRGMGALSAIGGILERGRSDMSRFEVWAARIRSMGRSDSMQAREASCLTPAPRCALLRA